MKLKVKRFIGLILAITALNGVQGCADEAETGTETAGTTAAETEEVKQPINFFGADSVYTLVRSEDADATVKDMFVRLNKAIKAKGTNLSLGTDWLMAGKEPGEFEILVGNTTRTESVEALAQIEGSGYIICVKNAKLVINATTEKALDSGITYFIDNILGTDMELTEGFTYTGTETVDIPEVTINGIQLRDFTIVVANTKTWELPVYTLTRFFSKYCGVTLTAAGESAATEGHKIIVGGEKSDGTPYTRFETELYFKDGDLHIGCKTATMAQKSIYTFIHQYLGKPGKAEVTIAEGSAVFNSKDAENWDEANPVDILTIQDRIVRSCYKLQALLEYDMSKGIYFTYENKGYKATVAEARESGIRCTNCVILGNWAMKDAGFYSSGIYNHTYDGSFGYSFSGESKTFFSDYFEVIDIRDQKKTIPELQSEGFLLDGDIIGFQNHNQTILPLGYAMDGGHGNCMESGAGARFARFVGSNPSKSTVVGFIIRAKDAD